jgi:hypothetical protein
MADEAYIAALERELAHDQAAGRSKRAQGVKAELERVRKRGGTKKEGSGSRRQTQSKSRQTTDK